MASWQISDKKVNRCEECKHKRKVKRVEVRKIHICSDGFRCQEKLMKKVKLETVTRIRRPMSLLNRNVARGIRTKSKSWKEDETMKEMTKKQLREKRA